MTKLKKTLLTTAIIVVSSIALIIIFISPIAKYLVQKYDVKYLGREITLSWSYVNPFTGSIHLSDLKIYEENSDSIFFSANGVTANFAMLKLFAKTYEISEITLNSPRGIIIQNKKDLNFNDLIERFTPKEKRDSTKAPVHFNILDIKITDGEFHYREEQIPINYFIKNVNIESTGNHWNTDTIAATFSLLSGTGGGDMKGDLTINLKNRDFRFAVVAEKFDLSIIQQYLNDLSNFGSFRANLDADIKASGNFLDKEDLTMSGIIGVNDLHLGKTPDEDFAAFDKLDFAIIEVSPKEKVYLIDSISLNHPYFKYERYDYLDNLQNMFGRKGSNISAAAADKAEFNLIIEIARYVRVLARNFFKSDYKINRLAIYKADIKFNDFSTTEKFAIELNPLTVIADSIDKKNKRVNVDLTAAVLPFGKITASLSINPKDSSDFDLNYHLQKMPLALFNPYIISYTSYPLDRGTLELRGKWNVRNGTIDSENRLTLIDPRVSKRIKNRDTKWIPVPLIMAFVREQGNVIDYQIPIKGDLKDPKLNLWDVIGDVVGNIFIKPVTIPYRTEVKNIETEIEKSLSVKWQTRSSSLLPSQEKFIDKIAAFLKNNPEASVTVIPQQYKLKETEYILFYEAKKHYYMLSNGIDAQSFKEEDSLKTDKMSVKDSLFVHFLKMQTKDSMLFTIQEKCNLLIDSADVINKFTKLNKQREHVFMQIFKEADVQKQVKITAGKNLVPYNGFSFYLIEFNGELPTTLVDAYSKMSELNDEAPRKRFKKERKEIKH
ncbi:MAG: DUF748 domain-containing protein [Bacteroidia bacterium]